jgi:geranylgeranyl diphosphate synthase, type II
MSYSLFAGGKRFRPVLAILAAGVFGADPETVMPYACALEFVHTYSLIHDDLPAVDNDDLRRGRPTCHKKFGEDIAIMAGDALFAEAFSLVGRLQKASDQRKIVQVLTELAEAAGPRGMVGGQVVDMISGGKTVDLQTVNFIHSKKTGRLITAAARGGAILAGADERDIESITRFGEHLGLAFQIADDVLDETGSAEELGKTPGKDKAEEKATYPALIGIEKAIFMARGEAELAIAAVASIEHDTKPLEELALFAVERTG